MQVLHTGQANAVAVTTLTSTEAMFSTSNSGGKDTIITNLTLHFQCQCCQGWIPDINLFRHIFLVFESYE